MSDYVFKPPYSGGCACGAIRYELLDAPKTVYLCHCTECRRMTTSAFGISIPVDRQYLHFFQGELRTIERKADSGRSVVGRFCGDCGTRIIHEPPHAADMVILRGGTLDDPSWVFPAGNVWTKSALPWAQIDQSLLNYEAQSPGLDDLSARWHEMLEARLSA